jgi:hypothetical protein
MATLNRGDLEFILQQIQVAEAHAAGGDLGALVPNVFAPIGLRTVDGSFNTLIPGQTQFGAADQPFQTLVDPQPSPPYPNPGTVFDAQPRVISNLIAAMTSNNPAAIEAFVDAGQGTIRASDGALLDLDGNVIPAGTLLTIPNVAPDAGLSAPFNSWFTFFGQFFDHGLDLVTKSGTEAVIMPLQPDDPLFVPGSPTNFMVMSRATDNAVNLTTPFVDQNQTYTSHPSHQVFLREYVLTNNRPVATGRLIDGDGGNIGTWFDVKQQARGMLGIALEDSDIFNVPLLATDPYGRFLRGPNGLPLMMLEGGGTVEGNRTTPVTTAGVRMLLTS